MNDPGDISWIRVLFAFSFVLALMAGLGATLKYLNSRGFCLTAKINKPKRLSIEESLSVDARRRLVILRCDDREHLLLLGGQNDIVVDKNLPSKQVDAGL